MKARLRHIIQKYLEPKALVLMYHRVAEPQSDIWDIAVSPYNFEQHLQVLQRSGNVVPLAELAESLRRNSLRRNAIAITFDDGYIDNYLVAKPLLEKYRLPATFFIASGYIGQAREFWWDELEHLLLFSESLPSGISIRIGEEHIEHQLGEEAELSEAVRQKHELWKACEEASPTERGRLFYKLWEAIKPLAPEAQQEHLLQLKEWSGSTQAARQDFTCMCREQLLELSRSCLFTVGAHTASHVALAHHPADLQEQEMLSSRDQLADLTGRKVNLLAYPYGNYNETTVAMAGRGAFAAAFTTEEKPVTRRSHPLRIARFQVMNYSGDILRRKLQAWKNLM